MINLEIPLYFNPDRVDVTHQPPNLEPTDKEDEGETKDEEPVQTNTRRPSLKKSLDQSDPSKVSKGKSIQFKDEVEERKNESGKVYVFVLLDTFHLKKGTFLRPENSFIQSEGKVEEEVEVVEEETDNTHALNLVWGFGMTPTLPVLNLTTASQSKLFYACSHIGVIYDYVHHRQQLLQAHVRIGLPLFIGYTLYVLYRETKLVAPPSVKISDG